MDISKYKKINAEFTVNTDQGLTLDDTRFVPVTIYVMHTGQNYNGSVFTKEVVDANADSIKNTAILGYLETTDGKTDFKGHQYKEITDENGTKKYIYAGNAYGVIPESCNPRWENRVCSDGVEREFFTVDGLLWTKFSDAVDAFLDTNGKAQSMELEFNTIEGKENEDGLFEFTNFKFDGCCLLSSSDSSIQPAMIDSEVVPNFTAENIADAIKEKLNAYYSAINDKNNAKGVNTLENNNFTLTGSAITDELNNLLCADKYIDKWGYESPRYLFVDTYGDEVIVHDRADGWRLYGMKYTVENDKVAIDFTTKKAKKLAFEDLEENTTVTFAIENTVNNYVKTIYDDLTAKISEKDQTIQTLTENVKDYAEIKDKLDKYEKAEQERVKEETDKLKQAEFARFDPYIGDNEQYNEIKNNMDSYSVDQIKEKCAVLYVEKNLNTESKKNDKGEMTAPVINDNKTYYENSRYGHLETKD